MEDITDINYRHAKKCIHKDFKIKNLGNYHDLYVQSDILLLSDVLKNFRTECIKTYELDSAHFFICTGISMAIMFKKKQRKN